MANTKISALPASTTPLAGTEVLPIVQSSTTRQVSVANLTAGRAVATGALTVTGAATVSSTLGVTGVATLGAGAILNTPASVTLTNATGLPISTGVSGLGTGVATALAVNVGSAGAPLVNGGVLGTPLSGTATNLTGLPLTTGVTGTLPIGNGGTGLTSTPANGALDIGNGTGFTRTTLTAGSNVTITNASGAITIAASSGGSPGGSTTQVQYNNAGAFGGITGATTNGTALTLVAPVLGTPASATLTNATGLPLTTGVTGTLPTANGGTNLTSFTANGVVYASSSSVLATGSALVFDGTNLGIGITPTIKLDVSSTLSRIVNLNSTSANGYGMAFTNSGTDVAFIGSAKWNFGGALNDMSITTHGAYNLCFGTNDTERARIDSSGNLLVGTTSLLANEKMAVVTGNATGIEVKNTGGGSNSPFASWNATTSGDPFFAVFGTETSSFTLRGQITYNRSGGLTVYSTTSDYRAKDIYGFITNSGSIIDSVPVYMGKMHGATEERPMFLAHETPIYAHTGIKDAVDENGKPIYQQMDASALVPVMWAEIQSLRQRLAAANL